MYRLHKDCLDVIVISDSEDSDLCTLDVVEDKAFDDLMRANEGDNYASTKDPEE